MRHVTKIGFWLALFAVPAVVGAEERLWNDFEEGLWEFEVRYEVTGDPARFAPYTTTRCLSRDEPFPRIEREGQECKLHRQPALGRSVSWIVNCSSDWEMVHGQGRMTYVRDHGNGSLYVQILGPSSSPYNMVFHLRGQRVGECP